MVFNPAEVLEATLNSLKAGHVYLIEKNTYKDQIQQHLLRLDSDDRRLRFGSNVSDVTIDKYVTTGIQPGDFLFAIFDASGEIVAFLHTAKMLNDSLSYELGLSVDLSARKNGHARALFEKAISFVKTLGAKRIFTYCLSENTAIQKLSRHQGMKVMIEHGEATAELEIKDQTVSELMHGLVDFMTTQQLMIFDKQTKNAVDKFLIRSQNCADLLAVTADQFKKTLHQL